MLNMLLATTTVKRRQKMDNKIELALTHMTRSVEGYNPNEKMISLPDRNGNPSLYLTVAHRKDWFFRWCQQEGLVGFIDEGEPEYDAQIHQVVTTARILVNGEVIGLSRGGKPFNPQMPETSSPTILQEVTTLAVGRALANCGFGTVGAMEDKEPVNTLADAPVADCPENQSPQVPTPAPQTAPASVAATNPMVAQTKKAKAPTSEQTPEAEAAKDAALLATLKPASQMDIPPVKTLDQARAVIMPIGDMKGRTLGEIVTTQQEGLHVLNKVSRELTSNKVMPNLARAIRVVINQAQK